MGDEEEKKGGDCVKVAIRCRPPSSKEINNGENSIVVMEESVGENAGGIEISDPSGKEQPTKFAFDIVFGMETEQALVYETVGKPAIESTLSGYNGTIFAYGQTGSGKSWCMTGAPGDLRGIIPRVNEMLFVRIAADMEEMPSRKYLVMCSFFEIYNEIIFDLLNPVQDRSKLGAGLQVKEHPVLGIYVKDLQDVVVTDGEKLEKLMASGNKNRAVSSTMMNASSSRSHSIFSIKVHQKDEEDKSKNVFAKLNLVDLAGSERQKGTGASGQTLKEGANINKSLSALGNVINALVENANGKKVFVPYRNSKLTRVLQESLGGNSLCTMLATLSPAACNFEETLSTLRYANRAKAIKVAATKNEEASQISRLNVEIEDLKKKLTSAGNCSAQGAGGLLAEEERQEIKDKFSNQLAEMEAMRNSSWEEKSKLSASYEAQLSRAQEEQKRQVRVMEEESRKRFRLLQDQNDIELTIRGLLDTFQSLPSKADGPATQARSALCSGELPRQWLSSASSISEATESLKQQHTMALMFQGAFSEDLRMWIDGCEAADTTMSTTGVRRATKKLETLRKECEKLAALESEGQKQVQSFADSIAEARKQWLNTEKPSSIAEYRRQEDEDNPEATPSNGAPEAEDGQRELPALFSRALEDIGRILQLAEQQVQAGCSSFISHGAMKMAAPAELVLRGTTLLSDVTFDAADEAVMRGLTGEQQADDAPAAEEAAPVEKAPRTQRPPHEWEVVDVDSSVEGTEYVLSALVELQCLNKKRTPQELLSRPPPKFVHDVAVLVRAATGFLPTMCDHWPESREEKLDLLQYISDSTAASLGMDSIDFDPADVLKGKEVEKTLRLLQYLAVAAAREKHGASRPVNGAGGKAKSTGEGLTSAGAMPPVLDTMSRFLQKAGQIHDEQLELEQKSGRASPTKELENSFNDLQERLEEESKIRQKQEERLAELQKQLDANRTILGERNVHLDNSRQVACEKGDRKEELRRQVEKLRAGLLRRAQQMNGNAEVINLSRELQEVARAQSASSQEKDHLASEVKRYTQNRLEADTERETLELEVKRMKLRMAEGIDSSNKIHQTDEILRLQAEKQKLDVRLATLEEKLRNIAEADDLERQRETSLVEDMKAHSSSSDDCQMQLQVILEERDALREGMDHLWQEKTRNDEELENVLEGYTHLSDRLLEKTDENRELEERLQEYENLLSMLQQNYEKNRHSPAMNTPSRDSEPVSPTLVVALAEPTAPSPVPPAPVAAPVPAAAVQGDSAAAKEDGTKGDDNGSSHYSEDDFEEEEDADLT